MVTKLPWSSLGKPTRTMEFPFFPDFSHYRHFPSLERKDPEGSFLSSKSPVCWVQSNTGLNPWLDWGMKPFLTVISSLLWHCRVTESTPEAPQSFTWISPQTCLLVLLPFYSLGVGVSYIFLTLVHINFCHWLQQMYFWCNPSGELCFKAGRSTQEGDETA